MTMRGQLKTKIKSAPTSENSNVQRALAYIRDHSPCSSAAMAEALGLTKHHATNTCNWLKTQNKIHRYERLWLYGPAPKVESAPKVERYIPPTMKPGSMRHWTEDVPAERLVAFKLPSLVNGRRVYPKGHENEQP